MPLRDADGAEREPHLLVQDFTPDFLVWIVFYGPQGGEA
jgi:hypothetical protein